MSMGFLWVPQIHNARDTNFSFMSMVYLWVPQRRQSLIFVLDVCGLNKGIKALYIVYVCGLLFAPPMKLPYLFVLDVYGLPVSAAKEAKLYIYFRWLCVTCEGPKRNQIYVFYMSLVCLWVPQIKQCERPNYSYMSMVYLWLLKRKQSPIYVATEETKHYKYYVSMVYLWVPQMK